MTDIFKEYKEYKPVFLKTEKAFTLKESLKILKECKVKLSKIKEEDEEKRAEVLDDVLDHVSDALSAVIDNCGAGDPIVDDLIDAAKDVEIEKDIAELEDGEEVIMAEDYSEDDKKDKEEDDKEKVEEGEVPPQFKKDDEKKDDEDKKDDKKEESFHKPYVSFFKK